MKRLLFSPAAQRDVEGIWEYSADQWRVDQADHYVDMIGDACTSLATRLRQGVIVDAREGYRKLLVASHAIYYRDEDEAIAIIRVLHGRQDRARNLP